MLYGNVILCHLFSVNELSYKDNQGINAGIDMGALW